MFSNNSFSDLVSASRDNKSFAILQSASTLFSSLETPVHAEIKSYEELALRFLSKVSLLERIQIVDIIAKLSYLPRKIALTLALDDISVAQPILLNFDGFSDNDLLMIMTKGTTLHALAICERKNLSDKILLSLAHYKVVEWSNEEPRNLITHRSRTPVKKDHKSLEFFLDHEEAYILEAMRWAEEKAQTHSPIDLAGFLLKAKDTAQQAIAFVKLARTRNKQAYLELLSTKCSLKEAQTSAIIEDPRGYALAVCLKSLALPEATARESFLLLNDRLARNIDQIIILDRFYSQITPNGCRFLVRLWQSKEFPIIERNRDIYQPVFSGNTLLEKQKKDFQTTKTSSPAHNKTRFKTTL